MRGLVILLFVLRCAGWAVAGEAILGAPPKLDLAVTNGLVRWWPNLFDAREELSGREGVVMGVLPPVPAGAEDPVEFGPETAWVQLQPAIDRAVFTLSLWVRCRKDPVDPWAHLLGQETSDAEWWFQTARGGYEFVVGRFEWEEGNEAERVSLTPEVWNHVALARRPDGTTVGWVDGIRQLDGRKPHPWPESSRWLRVGGSPRTWNHAFHGSLCDLAVFDRVLEDREAAALHAAGRPHRPVRHTAARLAATVRPVSEEAVTNRAPAPARTWSHRRYTTEDGLPSNILKAVRQTQDGFLWVGTDAGLARFDGRQFRVFDARNTPALKTTGATVWSLSEDRDGTLWVGTFGGLVRVRRGEFEAYTRGLPQRFVLQAEPAGDGTLWLAGFRADVPRGPCWLRRYDPATGTSRAEVEVPGHIRRLVPDTHGVWLATEQPQQIHFWDGQTPSTTPLGSVDTSGRIRLSAAGASAETTTSTWIDTGEPQVRWTEVRLGNARPAFAWLCEPRLSRPVAARWSGPPAEDIWLGVSFGLARIHDHRLEAVRFEPEVGRSEISCVCANREGGVWFGTEEDGLHLVQERLVRVHTRRDGLSGDDVRAVCTEPGGGVWVATGGGRDLWRDGPHPLPGRATLRTIATDPAGDVWFGLAEYGRTAVRRGDSGSAVGTAVHFGLDWQDPNGLRFARDGTLWVTCEFGLTWVKPGHLRRRANGDWEPDPASPGPASGRYAVGRELPRTMVPLGLVEDGDGTVWMGSEEHGLFRVGPEGVERFGRSEGLPADRCIPVHRDAAGAIWIVGEGGLTRRAGERFRTVTENDGLPRDRFLDLAEDDLGNFWITGQRGIHRVAREEVERVLDGTLTRVRSLTLGVRDGLLTPECSHPHYPSIAKTRDGHLWVATRNGLATFDPRRVRLDSQPLPVILERVVVNRREGPDPARTMPSASLVLPPGSGRQLEFHFTAISLVASDRVRFRHRLVGYDSDWSAASDLRLAFYTNLRPGQYRFEVMAANAHGLWNERPAALDFAIRPHFWQTTAFKVLAGLLALAVAVVAHSRRLAGQRRAQELRHRQTLTDEKARIAADLHDDLGAVLTQIAIAGEVGKAHVGDSSRTRSNLERISQAARDATSRMSDLVWATNPRHDTLESLVAYLREHAASRLENTPLAVHLEFPTTVPDVRVSALFRRNLLLVTKEALTNLLRHAQAGTAGVRLAIEGDCLTLGIHDDGRGFEPDRTTGTGNGLANLRKRVRDLGGEFRLDSTPGGGTRIELRVPLR